MVFGWLQRGSKITAKQQKTTNYSTAGKETATVVLTSIIEMLSYTSICPYLRSATTVHARSVYRYVRSDNAELPAQTNH